MDYPDNIAHPGTENHSPAERLALHLRDTLAADPSFYLFSPDETMSNKLTAAYEATDRAWTNPLEPWDKYMSPSGHIIELLSENTLLSMLTGHLISGGTGALASYEAFLPIVSSQLDQHLKFLTQSKSTTWRPAVPSLNLLATSTWQRQDHNGFSHQNPTLISSLLAKPSNLSNCLFPVDDIATTAAWEFATSTKDTVNLITFNKTEEPRWIDIHHARYQLEAGQGASIFGFASDEDPDLILAAAGDISSREALLAIRLIKHHLPDLHIRFVGITALSYQSIGTTENQLSQSAFDHLFTRDRPIIANFHGYPITLASILGCYTTRSRLTVHGFLDRGSTTTPLDMLIRNETSRYDLAATAFTLLGRPDLAEQMHQKITENTAHIKQFGLDLPDDRPL